MAVKYVKDFAFDSGFGFSGSNGKTPVKPHMRSAPSFAPAMVEKPTKGMGGLASETKKLAPYNKPHTSSKKGPSVAMYAKGGVVKKAGGGLTDLSMKENVGVSDQRVPVLQRGPGGSRVRRPMMDSKSRMRTTEFRDMNRNGIDDRDEMMAATRRRMRPGRGELMMARRMESPMMYAKGGLNKGEKKIGRVMGEFKEGKLHSGSKEGPKVKNPKQAIAIALSEARKAGAKIPKKAKGGMACD